MADAKHMVAGMRATYPKNLVRMQWLRRRRCR